ncbi:nitroreductase [Deinobacterium chartae]|uniref:Nitroreductase n=1 Tax=Deinobacterium chartae TaxID=521158 RepID=A0A841HY82_9DEIO|nr:nitroreductase family protein [Deinobacterium chartae]MBB6098501.1 nitroreductase [Deinobacterium chartae]
MTQTQTDTRILDVATAIETRVSVRQYVPDSLPQADLERILELGSKAPSAFNAQPWRFVVVRSEAVKEQLKAAAYGQAQITSAPATIVIYSDMEDVMANAAETAHPGMGEEGKARQVETFQNSFGAMTVEQRAEWANAQSYIALGFLMLAARGMGYDTVPMLGFDPEQVKTLLGLPAHAKIAALLPIGKAAQPGFPQYRHPLGRIVSYK